MARRNATLADVRTLFDVGTMAGLTDGELLERYATRSGEAAELAFTALVERHGPTVLRVCRATLRDPHDAHDAFQATFLVLMRRVHAIRNPESLASWLFGVASRIAWSARSADLRRKSFERRAAAAVEEAPPRDERHDVASIVHDELARLPERYRTPIILCYFEGRSCEEAARRLRMPVGTVKSRLARGRERMRAALTRRGLATTTAAVGGWLAAEARAGVPQTLIASTVRAALGSGTGGAAAGVVPAAAIVLAEGALRTMFLTKLKIATAALAVTGAVATGWARQQDTANPGPSDGSTVANQAAPLPRPESPAGREEGAKSDLDEVETVIKRMLEQGPVDVSSAGELPIKARLESKQAAKIRALLEYMQSNGGIRLVSVGGQDVTPPLDLSGAVARELLKRYPTANSPAVKPTGPDRANGPAAEPTLGRIAEEQKKLDKTREEINMVLSKLLVERQRNNALRQELEKNLRDLAEREKHMDGVRTEYEGRLRDLSERQQRLDQVILDSIGSTTRASGDRRNTYQADSPR